jgi:DNA-directed RNA polymerase subunit RPC12/RpoP
MNTTLYQCQDCSHQFRSTTPSLLTKTTFVPEGRSAPRASRTARASGRGGVMAVRDRTALEEDDEAWSRAELARVAARPRKALRPLISTTCAACGHEFLADSTSLRPEGCPECGFCQEVP